MKQSTRKDFALNFVPKPDICQPTGSAELPMLDVYMPMMKSAAIVSAAQLGLFQALAEGPLSGEALANQLSSNDVGVRTLADFLVAIGYLSGDARGYANTPSTQRWFTRAGSVDYTPGALWTHEAWSMMGGLTPTVQAGKPPQTLWHRMTVEPHMGPLFSRYMQAFAQDLGPDLVQHTPIRGQHRRLLDLGGSHGLHSLRFCQANPHLQAVIVDMPSALTDTPATLSAAGMQDRVSLRPGNLLDLDWGEGYDVVLYLSVGHNQTAQDNQGVMAHIAKVLKPGGLLVVHDYLAGTPLNAFHAAFRVTLLLETGTRTYSEAEYQAWFSNAGLQQATRVDLNPLEKGSLLFAAR